LKKASIGKSGKQKEQTPEKGFAPIEKAVSKRYKFF
jgi:hypothetical protein